MSEPGLFRCFGFRRWALAVLLLSLVLSVDAIFAAATHWPTFKTTGSAQTVDLGLQEVHVRQTAVGVPCANVHVCAARARGLTSVTPSTGLAAARAATAASFAAEGPLHHTATNKNNVSTARGGPWTPKFQAIFDKAGMSLNDPANLITVPGHYGPHPELYHQAVLDRLLQATDGLTGEDYAQALRGELASIGQDAQTPGTSINGFLTGGC